MYSGQQWQHWDTQRLACYKVAAVALVWDISWVRRQQPAGRCHRWCCIGLCDGRQCSQHSQKRIHQSTLTHGCQDVDFCATILTRVYAAEIPDDLLEGSGRFQVILHRSSHMRSCASSQ
jgi:hypothetical protein